MVQGDDRCECGGVIQIRLAQPDDFAQVWQLLQEYFTAVQVVVRDEEQAVRNYLEDPRCGTWLAYCEGELSGCIALRRLSDSAGEIKRLFVRPEFRRAGVAARLLAELEAYARGRFKFLYLDSNEDLRAAVVFYERAGYTPCERYNSNPQATIFLRKVLARRRIASDSKRV